MPLPKPKESEKKNDFISRCMSDESMKSEFDDHTQRVAVCYSLFDRGSSTKTEEDFQSEIDKINKLERKLDMVQHIEDLQENAKNFGYKIVAYENGKAFSIYDQDITIETEKGSVIEDPNGIYLGTSEDFVMTYYTGLTDYDDLLLTYQYDDKDIIKGNKNDKDSEIIVTKAVLVDAKRV